MKKNMKTVVAGLLIGAMCLTACGAPANTKPAETKAATEAPETEAETEAATEAAETEEAEKTYAIVSAEDTQYVPLTEIVTDLGFEASEADHKASVSNGKWTVEVDGDNAVLTATYSDIEIPVQAMVQDDVIYMSVKAMNEFVNVDVTPTEAGDAVTAAVSAVAASRDDIRTNAYGVNVNCDYETYELMLPMDDGVALRTIVYKPVGDGPFPTAVTRGPYPAQEATKSALGEEYAKRGMAYVFQYCRGKGGSEGEYVANVDERRDGSATLEWLNAEPWVESIGMHGHSYLALTTWIVGDILPEKVKALHVQSYGVLRNLSVSHSGQVASDNIVAWTLANCTDQFTGYDKYYESAQYLPNIKVDEDLWGTKVEGYADWVNHPDFTDDYWNEGVWGDLKNAIGKIDVPTSIFVGYYDHHFEGTTEAWNMLNDETKAMSHMVLGPWTHSFTNAIGWKGGSNWALSIEADTFNWFYSILVNGEVPATGIDAYVVGSDEWVHLDSFPMEATGELNYYMTDEVCADVPGTAYALTEAAPEADATFEYAYDPLDPKWAEGGECFLYSPNLIGSNMLSDAGYRTDVISFVTEAFEEDTTIAGNLVADLCVSTDVEDTAFTFTISEVDEDGNAYNIRNGLLTLAYRNDRYAPAVYDYVPGDLAEVRIESLPIVWSIPAGHRIRVDISSSDFPEFTNHTNTVGHWAEQTETKVANQVIYVGGDTASTVSIPILK